MIFINQKAKFKNNIFEFHSSSIIKKFLKIRAIYKILKIENSFSKLVNWFIELKAERKFEITILKQGVQRNLKTFETLNFFSL